MRTADEILKAIAAHIDADGGWEMDLHEPTRIISTALSDAYAAGRAAGVKEAASWRPIETAPRDGTCFDAWTPSGKERIPDVYWKHKDAGWVRDEYELNYGWVATPVHDISHWRPVPAPPIPRPADDTPASLA